ncbi:hypothetical protein F4777DRAFT_283109 [Nemania sp. FL0916]|nr:hypothetical protein F4777DRAFT_283109 [Nemania sp. FL0916]
MKYLALIVASLLGTTATPVSERQSTQATITSFSAGTNITGPGASFAYDIEIPGLATTHCSYSDTTSEIHLPTVDQTPCADPSVRWQFRQDPSQPGGMGLYRIVVIYTPPKGGAGKSGFHEWAWNQFLQSGEETIYQGPSTFTIGLD